MDTKLRFRDTRIWESKWFGDLSARHKLFYQYINDSCNNIGIWTPNISLVMYHLDFERSLSEEQVADEFLKSINGSETVIEVLKNGDWFICGFVKFQYCNKGNPLSSSSMPHRSYVNLMKKENMWSWFCENQQEVMPYDELQEFVQLKSLDEFVDLKPSIQG